jgi:hypothetical protein
MPIYYQSQLEEIAAIHNGIRVDSAAAAVTNAAVTKFTVGGGNVIMLGFVGEIEVDIPAGAITLAIDHTPTVGVVTPLASASANFAGYIAGRMCYLPAVAGALVWTATGGARMDVTPLYILRPGLLSATASITPATGTIRYTMWYVPIDKGAYVTGS